jgi:trans-aconitate methyltransferase
MLEVLNGKVQKGGMTNVATQLIDLERQGRLEGRYDLIVSSMTMHHVADVAALISSLAGCLNPGGWLAVADLQSEDGSFHNDSTGVLHNGFSKDFFRFALQESGLTDVRVVAAATMEKAQPSGEVRGYPVILAVGKREG